MNLQNKYTTININNVKFVITFLYNNGYVWANNQYYDPELNVDGMISYTKRSMSRSNNRYYIHFNENVYYSRWDIPKNKSYIDFNVVFREDKLKRILNTKCLIK